MHDEAERRNMMYMNGVKEKGEGRMKKRAADHGRILTAALAAAVLFAGCYTFRQGSALPHLKTVVIPTVNDNSGFGRSTIRFDMTTLLIDRFRSDNTMQVIDDPEADSRLEVSIVSIRTDLRRAVSSDERETVRGVAVEARTTFFDNVKNTAVYENRSFRGESSYDLSEGSSGEERAIDEALDALTNEILLATVADW